MHCVEADGVLARVKGVGCYEVSSGTTFRCLDCALTYGNYEVELEVSSRTTNELLLRCHDAHDLLWPLDAGCMSDNMWARHLLGLSIPKR